MLIDVLTALVMLAMIVSGLVVRYVLPTGSGGRGGGRGLVLWGLDRHDWGDVHFWLAVAVGALLVLHVALHWRWACATVRQMLRRGERAQLTSLAMLNLYGVGFLAAVVLLIGGFLLVAHNNVQAVAGEGGQVGRVAYSEERAEAHPGGESDVRGSMTLQEVANAADLGVDQLKELLGLPVHVRGDERLGRLKRAYGVEVTDVRRALSDYAAAQRAETTAGRP
ncbi:MAG: DUF4405 domain-containing protein [Planctomycetota bacterium]